MKLDQPFFQQLLLDAANSERKRAHFNLHKHFDEPVQRLCIGLIEGSYVRPHHHTQANKWELLLCLKGRVEIVIFNQQGLVIDKMLLAPNEALSGIELPPNTWHTVYPKTDEAVLLEVKQGPYAPATEEDFAPWAPKEGEPQARDFLSWVQIANKGERFTAPKP